MLVVFTLGVIDRTRPGWRSINALGVRVCERYRRSLLT
jgi:hypothetical protein